MSVDLGCKHGHFNCTQCYEEGRLASLRERAEVAEGRVEEQRALIRKMGEDFAEARIGILAQFAELYEHLKLMVQYLEEETSQGDGIAEEHFGGYTAAKALIVRASKNYPQWENAGIAVHELQLKASELPGLLCELDELRFKLAGAAR